MALRLTIDQGNSSAKLALWDDDGNVCLVETHQHFESRDVASFLADKEVSHAIYCNVGHHKPLMVRTLARHIPYVVDFGSETPSPLTLQYETPSTLGADRLAAAVGAWSLPASKGKDLLVVDIGTAVTYDRVTAEGCFVGGNIAPGIMMRLKALHHFTARLPLIDPRTYLQNPVFGNDTRSALLAGALRGVVAEIEYYMTKSVENKEKTLPATVLTGGDAERVARLLDFDVIVNPNLVSFGLLKILEYNITKGHPSKFVSQNTTR